MIRYVGISGYPVEVLAELAEMILQKTGEPLDAVLSYANFTIQNDRLGQTEYLDRFEAAQVGCLLNASILGMGLLTTRGVENGPMVSWHPAPPELRKRCSDLSVMAQADGEHLEEVSIRWALKNWARIGARFGTRLPATGPDASSAQPKSSTRIGVSVMGVSAVEELEETWRVWQSVMGLTESENEQTRKSITHLVEEIMWPSLGEWKNHAWQSGGASFINTRQVKGVIPADDGIAERWGIAIEAAVAG